MLQSIEQMEMKKSYNLQFMKFIAACLVIISHAYPLCGGEKTKDPLFRLTDGQLSFGGLAVSMFFLCGGYFIAKSIERKKTAKLFFKSRCEKIFPMLWVTVIGCILIGTFITRYSIKTYLLSSQTWMYLANCILIPTHNLPGVFENAPYNATVNGALWTLAVEFMCYIMCFLCYKLKLLSEKKFMIILIPTMIIAVGLIITEQFMAGMVQIIRPVILFVIGMFFWVYRKKIKFSVYVLLPTCILFFLGLYFHFANVVMFIVFPIICFILWFYVRPIKENIGNLGNISYGMYLCGFPLQQLWINFFDNNMNCYVNMLIVIPNAIVIGFLMYYFVEKNALKKITKG